MRTWKVLCVAVLACGLAGCPNVPPPTDHVHPLPAGPVGTLEAVNLSDPIRPIPGEGPIQLHAARNEWTSFALQVAGTPSGGSQSVSVGEFAGPNGAKLPADGLRVYQVLAMPVEVNPGFVRHTGLNTADRSIPRAMLPVPLGNGTIDLATLRDPTQPTNPAAHPNGSPVLLWVDVHVPAGAAPGDYVASCELRDRRGAAAGTPVRVQLGVYDFTLPEELHLRMVGAVQWNRLAALYPEQFGDTITPGLINRADPRYRKTVRTLDRLMLLSHEHRASLVIPGLRPAVKWPAGEPPQIDWREFDSLVGPWLRGRTFADQMPIGYWPVPAAPSLERFDAASRNQYWSQAISHFDQLGWLDRSPVELNALSPGRADAQEPADLLTRAREVLAEYPGVRVQLPLEDEQLRKLPDPLAPADLDRVITAAPPLVSSATSGPLNADAALRRHWLSTDNGGLVPYAGAGGDERDVRVWAWLAFLRRADLIVWDQTLPATDDPSTPADPNALSWFYPGEWFGVADPVPTIQLEWLRRAQQDYEYLWLARERGEVINALQMARLITKPVEIFPGQQPDPAYSLMSGTTDPKAWDRAQELLARTILLRRPGYPVDEAAQRALYIQTLQWAQPQEKPLLLARSARWTVQPGRRDDAGTVRRDWLQLKLGLDIYNASDVTPDKSFLQWSPPPPDTGWEIRPQPVEVPRLQTYHIQPATLTARYELGRITPDAGKPLELSFVNGFTRVGYPMRVKVPIAASERREGPISIDGRLTDWTAADALQDGPLVMMLDRPDLQAQRLQEAPVQSKIYSAWGRDQFYLAFALEGLSPESHRAHNDVYYQSGRAWGEDLGEALIQPVFADNSTGPLLHVVFKPNGVAWVERKQPSSDKPDSSDAWRAGEGSVLRYATTTTPDGRWRGEAAIPWGLIVGPNQKFPVLLRFNFCQHRQANCESSSWCGPVDSGRDDRLTGVLYLRSPDNLADLPRAPQAVLP